jgi:hypothetical protein
MGKSETATASLGIKFLLSDLVSQINETNFTLIKKMLYDGFIEDSNYYYDESYKTIIGYDNDDVKLPESYNEYKIYLTEELIHNGSYYKSKFSSKIESDLTHGCLWDQNLLIPIKDILETERWGYERYGINSASRELDFDLTINLEEYKKHNIEKYTVVFILKQHSG